MHPLALKALRALVALVILVGAVALFRDTIYQGQDFDVFWRTARHLLEGEPLYDVARDGAMVFKYPPWIAPFFLPFGLLPLSVAKALWALVELFSLSAVIHWLLKRNCDPKVVVGVSFLFWGIWAVHFLDGQIELPMLAVSLWAWEKGWFSAAVLALSTKIFSILSLMGFHRRTLKHLLLTGAILSALSVPAWWSTGSANPLELVHSWKQAAVSGGEQFTDKVRGRDNQGIPALILRSLQINAGESHADWIAALVCMLGIGGYWFYRSRALNELERWVGWLAFVCVIHPLAWFHLYVMAFPLAVVVLDQALRAHNRRLIFGTFFAIALIALVTRKTLPFGGERLELLSIKSFGVLLLMDMLLLLKKNAPPVRQPLRLVQP